MKQTASRFHDISCGHRVAGHESKCQHLHGHNYRVHFTCEADELDAIGRVIDFGAIKQKLCMWLEDNWDHKFLAWCDDALISELIQSAFPSGPNGALVTMLSQSLVFTPFNPTAENMARYLLLVVGPQQLQGTGVRLTSVMIDETRKCSAIAEL